MPAVLLLQLIVSFLCLTEASAAPYLAKPGCQDLCGNVSIPYPFGIGKNCYFDDYFSVSCNQSSSPPKPILNHPNLNLQLLNVSLEYRTVMVLSPIIPLCEDSGTWESKDLGGSPFYFSSVYNSFMVVGCDINAVLITSNPEEILTGCTSNCNSGIVRSRRRCYGIQCCQNTIPYSDQSSHIDMYSVNYSKTSNNCSYAFLGVRDWYVDNLSDPVISTSSGYAPLVMSWNMTTTSLGSCTRYYLDWQSKETFEVCRCDYRYEGNPYLPNGCQGIYSTSSLFYLFSLGRNSRINKACPHASSKFKA